MAKPPTTEELIAGLHKLSQRSDAANVLFLTTALEDMLERVLLYKMRNLSSKQHQDLFTGYGPLASFSAKIDISYAFSIIDDDLIGDFRALKAIRNAFAHPRQEIHFGSDALTKEIQKLKGYSKEGTRKSYSMNG
jgi:DNA-binding MltR family transcriptional regulator